MTRLWPQGSPIQVIPAGGPPQQFTWQSQTHQVAEITRHWRVHLDWWQTPVWRDYFKLTTQSGLLVIIYQELPDGHWYLQRLYD